jgi:predicted small lipoprotein YifL
MLNKRTPFIFSGKSVSFLFAVLFTVVSLSGCGKKEEAPKTDTNTPPTTENQTSGDKKKKEIKKSEAPKKDVTQEAPEDWTQLTSGDEKVEFSLPSAWTVEENSETRFSTLSEDKTMGTVLVTFPNDQISSEDLLELALGDFDFEPDGEANEIQVGNVDGYITAARGNVNGTDMMMYIMSAVESDGSGNYVIYVYTPTEMFQANSATMEQILYSIGFN